MSTKTMTSEDGSKYRLIYEDNACGVTITGISPKNVKKVVIPDEINGAPVTKIGHHAFCECASMKYIDIPKGVTYIGELAFSGVGCETIILPETLTFIDRMAFRHAALSSIYFGLKSQVKEIDVAAFCFCHNLKHITFPPKVTVLHDMMFLNCDAMTWFDGENIKDVAPRAFEGCKMLTDVYLAPDALWYNSSFRNTPLVSQMCDEEDIEDR